MGDFSETSIDDLCGNKIIITSERWKHIVKQHPEMLP